MNEPTLDVRQRIVDAAADLLARGGRDAVTTRAVSAAAGVQAPTIYRHFGDMRGLLDAAAHDTLAAYVRTKATRADTDDPVDDLRRGWDLHLAFGLANPAVYVHLYGDPAATASASAAREGIEVLRGLVARIAEAGRLRVSVAEATRLIHAAGSGVTLSLLAMPAEARESSLSETMREAVLAAVTVPNGPPADPPGAARVATRAVALRAVLDEGSEVLSPAESHLLGEWLDRLAEGGR
ncbi:MAG TPA: TetR/AcrR family transcriptional regulator [Longimicrobium sp.]|jgi:AcrR family transcriptional regulator